MSAGSRWRQHKTVTWHSLKAYTTEWPSSKFQVAVVVCVTHLETGAYPVGTGTPPRSAGTPQRGSCPAGRRTLRVLSNTNIHIIQWMLQLTLELYPILLLNEQYLHVYYICFRSRKKLFRFQLNLLNGGFWVFNLWEIAFFTSFPSKARLPRYCDIMGRLFF